jgi:hypothetical protein
LKTNHLATPIYTIGPAERHAARHGTHKKNGWIQGCQMVYFQTKNPNLGTFWRALECNFVIIWNILWPFGIIYGRSVQLVVIWYIFLILGCLHQEKSGNPGWIPSLCRVA